MVSEVARHLVESLWKGVQTCEKHVDDLVWLAKIVDHAPAVATLYTLARMQRVKALQFQGQIAALTVRYRVI